MRILAAAINKAFEFLDSIILKDFWNDKFICIRCQDTLLIKDIGEKKFYHSDVLHGVCRICVQDKNQNDFKGETFNKIHTNSTEFSAN